MLSQRKWCVECNFDTTHNNNKCIECADRNHRLARAKWKAMTADEKIEVLLKRIEALERGPARY